MSPRGEGHHGTRSCQPSCDDSLGDHDAPTPWVRESYAIGVFSPILTCLKYSLDHIANKIASATFQVLNAGRVKTADMGGKSLVPSSELPLPLIHFAGSSTTSEFTAAVIKNLE